MNHKSLLLIFFKFIMYFIYKSYDYLVFRGNLNHYSLYDLYSWHLKHRQICFFLNGLIIELISVYLHFNLTIFNFIDYYKTSSHTKGLTDSTTLVRNNKLTTYYTFSSMFYQTSERSLFTKCDNLTPISNQESLQSATIVVSMGCIIVIIFFFTLSVC